MLRLISFEPVHAGTVSGMGREEGIIRRDAERWRYLQMWRTAQKHLSNQRLELLLIVGSVSHAT